MTADRIPYAATRIPHKQTFYQRQWCDIIKCHFCFGRQSTDFLCSELEGRPLYHENLCKECFERWFHANDDGTFTFLCVLE